MKKYFNIIIIAVLGLLLAYLAEPRAERAYLHWRVISHTRGMSKLSSEWADIYYTDQDKEYAPLIGRLTDFYLPPVLADFKAQNPRRAVIIVYPSAELFNRAVGKLDALPMGAYYGGVINIISPAMWMANAHGAPAKDYFIQYGPLIHEFAHYAADSGPGKRLPPWLAEGVALYYEYKYTGVEWRPDLEKKASGIALEDLEKNFRVLDERVAYRKAFDVIKAFVRKYGEDRLQLLLAQA